MTAHLDTSNDGRVIVLAPTSRDAEATMALLTEAGLHACACATIDGAIAEARRGAAAFLWPRRR